MRRLFGAVALGALWVSLAVAGNVTPPASSRFADPETKEVPDFQRHVLPIMGRLGCNGRACHGSFQGQGGFQLSLFGYDFKMDHDALLKGQKPRVNLQQPDASLMLAKPTLQVKHEGGRKLDETSWQYNLLHQWIANGAKSVNEKISLVKIDVSPREIVFTKPGETRDLRVLAYWSDGSTEDVTCLCRFRTNNETIADISEDGIITAKGSGDTHVVAFYDNGVVPTQVILPVSDKSGENYPTVATPTKVDQLVTEKLRKLGVVPSELSTDAEFLRRVTLDITGTLPTPKELQAFLTNPAKDKRQRKIDELLERPAYAAWWSTRLCDITGNNSDFIDRGLNGEQSKQWYDWIYHRVQNNTPYDQLVAGIALATSRTPGQDYESYSKEMSSYFHKNTKGQFADRPYMPYFWIRRNLLKPEEKALAFAYTFLGVRLECAQCHKHPFDQWTKQDFDQFTAFFTRVNFGLAPDARAIAQAMEEKVGLKGVKGNQANKEIPSLLANGKVIPFREVFVNSPTVPRKPIRKQKNVVVKGGRVLTPKILGGEEVVDSQQDPRTSLMEWMRDRDNPYFARAFVNRVWAGYFNVGIIDPPDDQNLANPPSNEALLQYLTDGFISSGFNMKWLHREIANSATYQRSWQPNETNRQDERNFSRAVVRRLPAEVSYDALTMATGSEEIINAMVKDMTGRAIASGVVGRNNNPKGRSATFALRVFGKPNRAAICDCERSNDPTLLQSIFLRNDSESLAMLDRGDGWLAQLAKESRLGFSAGQSPLATANEENGGKNKVRPNAGNAASPDVLARQIEQAENRLKLLRENGKKEQIAKLSARLEQLKTQARAAKANARTAKVHGNDKRETTGSKTVAPPKWDTTKVIREAYARTLCRMPCDDEIQRAQTHFKDAEDPISGTRDLLWALVNTKEFITNH